MGAVDTLQDWKPHPRFPRVFLKPLVTREMTPGLTVNLVRVAPGGEIAPHVHADSTETFYVLAGRGICCIGDEECTLEPGACGFAPPGVSHAVRNIGDVDLEAISIFNPPP
jgi:mannose-6-phosphate isomerase-like protein (cupin superfamily)